MKEQIIETINKLKIFINEKFEHLDCWPTRLLKVQRAIANGSNVRGQKNHQQAAALEMDPVIPPFKRRRDL